jgi:general secretion pathway protein G
MNGSGRLRSPFQHIENQLPRRRHVPRLRDTFFHAVNSLSLDCLMHNRNTRSRCLDARPCVSGGANHRRGGFTLLELLLVLSILVVIGGIVMVNLGGAADDAKNDATRVQIRAIKDGISYFQIRLNSLPDSLEELVEGPSDAAKKAKWNKPILTEVPLDGWENEFVYSLNGNMYEIRSAGTDGQVNTDDDIVEEGP